MANAIDAQREEHADRLGVGLNLSVEGRERNLRKDAFEEASFVMKEAMCNAHEHSGGDLLSIHLNHRPDVLMLEVRDNGNDIDPAILDAGEEPGRWGLMGMRERAR